MKKVLFAATVLFAFCLTSCKKDFTCVCKESGVTLQTYTIHTTKKKATDLCNTNAASWSSYGTSVTCVVL
jgi:hypothetical protein